MWQILGNLYKRDTEISKNYLEIKELVRKALLKEPFNLSLIEVIKQLKDKKGFKDCNLITVLKAIEEVQKEEHKSKSKCFNINIEEIIISVDTLPF